MTADTLTIEVARPEDVAAVDVLLAHSCPMLLKADCPFSVMVLAVPLTARANQRLLTCGDLFRGAFGTRHCRCRLLDARAAGLCGEPPA